jgi:hypothetical protein
MIHPTDPFVTLDIKIRPAQKSSGEWQYSLGNPPLPERKFIEAVYYQGIDITEFINYHCDELFEKWEEQIND